MANYRKFWLINSLGKKWDFQNKTSKIFLQNPSGLGYSKTVTSTRLGDSKIVSNIQTEMPSPSGELIFYNSTQYGYQSYEDFVEFCAYRPLQLHYLTPNNINSYYIECDVVTVNKGEYSSSGFMSCSISFEGHTFWLNSNTNELVVNNNNNNNGGKHYKLQRDYYYPTTGYGNINVNIEGQNDAGFELIIDGYCVNPQLTAFYDDTAYGILKLNGEFDNIDVTTYDSNQTITLIKEGSYLSNALSYQDFSVSDGVSTLTFFKLKKGKNLLSFSCGNINEFEGTIKLKWRESRVSV